jgi:bacillithiol system protein YtxJ
MDWIQFTNLNQLNEIIEESKITPVLIFKHSTRCGISRFVLKNFEREYDIPSNKLHLYFLDLIAFREISNEVANKFNVRHQSPQIIVIQNGEVIYDESHNQIEVCDLKQIINK